MADVSKPLPNERHELFAIHFAVHGNAAKSWLASGGDNPGQADVNGSKWAKKGSIAQRVEWLKAEAARRLKDEADKAQEPALLSIMEKRLFCAAVVRTPIGEISETSPLCQSVKYTEAGKELKMPCKLKAIEKDNDLAGEGSEAGANGAIAATFAERLANIRSHKKQ